MFTIVQATWQALLASLALLSITSSHLSPPTLTALAFTLDCPKAHATKSATTNVKSLSISLGASRLFYQAGTEAYAAKQGTLAPGVVVSNSGTKTIEHIDNSNYQTILQNSLGLPVLVDCYVSNCGPCKLIERSLQSVLPGYSNDLFFCKWDANETENSQQFMNILRKHEMTFRKLPTLVLFVDGVPMAMRSGMGTAEQIGTFLNGHLPMNEEIDEDEEEECVYEVNLEGEKFLCEE